MKEIKKENQGKTKKQNYRAQCHKKTNWKFRIATAVCMVTVLCGIFGNFFTSAKEDSEEVYKYYKSIYIKEGDTLWTIAEQYQTEDCDSIGEYVRALMKINHLEDDHICFGERLIVAYNSSERLE